MNFDQINSDSEQDFSFSKGDQTVNLSVLDPGPDQEPIEHQSDSNSENSLEDEAFNTVLESLDINPQSKTKLNESEFQKKEAIIIQNKQNFDILTEKLEHFDKKLFNCDLKVKDLIDFEDLFLRTFKVKYYGKKKLNKNLENFQYFIYTKEIDYLFILPKDVIIELEVENKSYFSECLQLFWDNIIDVSKKKNIVSDFGVKFEENLRNNKKSKLIFNWLTKNQTYNIIIRCVKKIKTDIFYYQTKLISRYAKMDNRFRILSGFLIYWGITRKIFNSKFNYNDLLFLLVFFFLSNKLFFSIMIEDEFKFEHKKKVIYQKSHLDERNKWKLKEKEIDLGFLDDSNIVEQLKTAKKINNQINSGEILARFFNFYSNDLLNTATKLLQASENKQKFPILNVKNGKIEINDHHDDVLRYLLYHKIENNFYGYFIKDPFLQSITTPHLISIETKESLTEKIKQFIYDCPYKEVNQFIENLHFNRIQIEFDVAFKRIRDGNGNLLCDDIDYRKYCEI